MDPTATLFGQSIAFALFVLFCMRFVWPPLIAAMRERKRLISEGLEKATRAERQLENAEQAASLELEKAKARAAELIEQANRRASQIIEDAREQARADGERLLESAQAQIEQERNRAKEALRARVGELAVLGAERILETSVDKSRHEAMLARLAAEM